MMFDIKKSVLIYPPWGLNSSREIINKNKFHPQMKIKHIEVSFQIVSPADFINWNENNIAFGDIWPSLFF